MTCCVGALADKRKTVILVADRMVGRSAISAEPDIRKIVRVHKDWWVAIAGYPVAAAPILEHVERALPARAVMVDDIKAAFVQAMRNRWAEEAEVYLAPHGLTAESFRDSRKQLGKRLFREIDDERSKHEVSAAFIIGGFGSRGVGYILVADASAFSVSENSISGYSAIGTGTPGADFMMKYKNVGPRMPVVQALYYAIEGKYFGELAYGVGTDTDVRILRSNKRSIKLGPRVINKKIIPICRKLQPRFLRKRHAKRILKMKKLERLF
jgi:hypothetical protein